MRYGYERTAPLRLPPSQHAVESFRRIRRCRGATLPEANDPPLRPLARRAVYLARWASLSGRRTLARAASVRACSLAKTCPSRTVPSSPGLLRRSKK
jgi:hypothetical protein